jgi:hypothetical protein
MADEDFSTAASIALTVPDRELRSVRDQVSDIGPVPVSVEGGRATAGSSAFADGGAVAVADELSTQTDLLDDILEELERGGLGGGDDGGLDPLSFIAGSSAAGATSGGAGLFSRLSSRLGSSNIIRAIATGGASITGGVGAPVLTSGAFQSSLDFVSDFTGTDASRPESIENTDPLVSLAPQDIFGGLGLMSTDAPTDEELPGNITRETIRANNGMLEEPSWLDTLFSAEDLTLPEPDWLSTAIDIFAPETSGENNPGTGDGTVGGVTDIPGTSSQTGLVGVGGQSGAGGSSEDPLPDYFTEANKEAIREQRQRRNRAKENRQTKPTVNNTNDVTVDATLDIRNVRELQNLLKNPERWVRNNLNISSVGRGP